MVLNQRLIISLNIMVELLLNTGMFLSFHKRQSVSTQSTCVSSGIGTEQLLDLGHCLRAAELGFVC